MGLVIHLNQESGKINNENIDHKNVFIMP